jgi:hypothetical protein
MSLLDREGIAARIRSLIAPENDMRATAELLRVPIHDLKSAVDPLIPFQTLGVLEAVVREFGVDPTWLITGDYDIRTHVLSVDEGPWIVKGILNEYLLKRSDLDPWKDGPSAK